MALGDGTLVPVKGEVRTAIGKEAGTPSACACWSGSSAEAPCPAGHPYIGPEGAGHRRGRCAAKAGCGADG